MTILRPSLTAQDITIIPRYSASNIILNLLNQETQVNYNFEIDDYIYSNGYLTLGFDFNCLEGESFNLEVLNGDDETNNVLFRGKAFATDEEDLENYKLSKNLLQ